MGLVRNHYYKMVAQLVTFSVVVLTLALFRSDTVSTTGYLLSRLFVLGGSGFVPEYLKDIQGSAIFKIKSIFSINQDATIVVYGSLFLALAACWLLPSTVQLFQRQEVMLQKPMAGRTAVVPVEWQANSLWATYIAALATLCFLNLGKVSEFLYFQF